MRQMTYNYEAHTVGILFEVTLEHSIQSNTERHYKRKNQIAKPDAGMLEDGNTTYAN